MSWCKKVTDWKRKSPCEVPMTILHAGIVFGVKRLRSFRLTGGVSNDEPIMECPDYGNLNSVIGSCNQLCRPCKPLSISPHFPTISLFPSLHFQSFLNRSTRICSDEHGQQACTGAALSLWFVFASPRCNLPFLFFYVKIPLSIYRGEINATRLD